MATTNERTATYTTHFTTPNDREIVATRVFDAPRRLVWEAHVKPEHVSKWLLGPDGWTMPVCEIDLRPGGEWHYVWRKDDGKEFGMRGVFQEVAPPERLVMTEAWGDEWPETLNSYVFTEENGRTTVTCTVTYPSREARDAAMGTGMESGWARSNERLDEYLVAVA